MRTARVIVHDLPAKVSVPRKLAHRLRRGDRRWVAVDRVLVRLGVHHFDARRFLVATQARSGSNLLISALRSHPQVYVEGELLRRLSGSSVDDVLARIYGGSRRRTVAAVGFKMFYYHPLDGDPVAAWARVHDVDDLHLVHLTRRNRLRTLTSRRIAGATQEWVDVGHRPSRRLAATVTFTTDELVKHFERAERLERQFEERFADCPILAVEYEDLARDVGGEVRRVTRFLGLHDADVAPLTSRQNPQPLSSLIANYDELEAALRDTRWSAFFDG